ncbi:hypothetical protein [Microlunatus parietis]|uniref:Uncharacterized protein n=1 Tax=Microlunatus parietis TaxID=682979 RepID=A0A7Y9LEK2_9ACTN|nr:hypothetical protein [Microlunatus parietis]NYE73933.1 hypothetical protein [Microlunatus parietis]
MIMEPAREVGPFDEAQADDGGFRRGAIAGDERDGLVLGRDPSGPAELERVTVLIKDLPCLSGICPAIRGGGGG